MAPTRSPYLYTENVIIQAGETLFSIPKHIIALPGTSFESTFLLPAANSITNEDAGPSRDFQPENVEGKSDENPIRLPESITARQFTHFLSFVYKHSGYVVPKPSTLDEWMAVYNLASMWSFDSVQKEASSVLRDAVSTKSGLDCIKLGRRYNVGSWIKRGIFLLIQQKAPLNLKKMKEVVEVEVKIEVEIPSNMSTSIFAETVSKKVLQLKRDESGMKPGVEEIFASEYAMHQGLGKESLDVDLYGIKKAAVQTLKRL